MSPKTNAGPLALGSGLAFCSSRALVLLVLWWVAVSFAPLSLAVTFTSNVVIPEGDTTYDGQDIIVNGATATINGPHSFTSLTLTNGAILSHAPCTATATHKLELSIAGTLSVDATSRIDVSGKGYLPGRTSGNTTVGGSRNISGGSYGGLGGLWTGGGGDVVAAVYGDYADPDDWGSGAGNNTTMSGGGLVRLTATTLVLDGQILANGLTAGATGGGAGGGIYVAVQTLQGGGSIRAHGGGLGFSQTYGGGGGGRVAGGGVCRGLLGFHADQHQRPRWAGHCQRRRGHGLHQGHR